MLSELIKAFVNGAVTEAGVFTSDGLKKLKALLGTTTQLRVFVSKSRGLGHQASSINILKRLISFGYTGEILVVYDNNKDDPTLNKLAILLPGFDPKNPGKPFKVGDVPLKFVELSAAKDLALQPLAITGGYDEKDNLATKLNVQAFLQLQPFQWTTQSNYLWLKDQAQPIDLNASEELGSGSFVQRAYYLPQPKVTDAEWDLFFEIPNINSDMLHTAELLDGYLSPGTDKAINFLPVYGVGDLAYNGLPTLPASAPHILFNLLAGVAVAQEQGSAANSRPTVIAVMTELKKESWADFKALAAGTLEAEGTYKRAMQWAVAHKLPERVKILSDIDADKFEKLMQALESKQILVINLPKVPPALFDLLYSLSTLPFVFEGKGTANLALNLGKPYMHMAKSGVMVYPNTFLTYAYVDAMTRDLMAKVFLLQSWVGGWPAKEVETPGFQIGRFIANATVATPTNAYAKYFTSISAFYHAEQNDKLLMGLLYWLAKHPPALMLLSAEAAEGNPLKDLYDKLVANNSGGALSLIPGALSTGTIVSYLGSVIGSQNLTIGSSAAKVTIDFPDPFNKITVKGVTTAFGDTELTLQVVFTVAEDNKTINSDVSLSVGTIQLPDVPWFALEDTNIAVNIPGGGRVTGVTSLTCRFGDTPLSLTTQFPTVESQILVEGSFDNNPPSFSSLFQVLGGINIVSTLPAPLNVAANLSLESFKFGYDYSERKIAAFNVDLKTTQPWPLFGKLTLESMDIHIAVASPTESREVSWSANSSFGIGPGVIAVGVTYPNLSLTAQLAEDSKAIPVGDLLTFFLPPDVTLNLGANLSKFSMQVTPGAKDAPATYNVQAALDTESWNLTVNSFTFGITDLSVLIDNNGAGPTGTLGGTIALFKDDPSLEFALNLGASYLGKGKGWKFTGKQTGNPIKVKEILAKYVSPAWASGVVPDIDIDGLGFQIEAGGSGDSSSATAYSFNGTVKIWNTPLGDSFETTIKAEFGYNGGSKTLGPSLVRTNGADFPPLEDEDFLLSEKEDDKEEKKVGKYGEISADIRWQGIELTVFYNFDPDYRSYGIVWGILTGKIEDKTVGGKPCKVATLSFTKNVTLGSMIETMVSWITGVKFGLEAPFSVLNNVSLSGLQLHYNFTTKNVTFSVKIGPIDLGIMRIDTIDVNYASGEKDPKNNGLMVSLTGSFPWNTGDSANGDTGNLGPWDASEPGAAPAPPGGGNKYLDLRLLALGQHVTVPGLLNEKSVMGVIGKLENLNIPKPPDIPINGDNQPVFDANSSWFVAFDFGVLKVEKDKKKNGNAALLTPGSRAIQPLVPVSDRAIALAEGDDGEDDKDQYFISLAIVFNDPYLYGLRIALDGPMAKVFAGLDFQIMYQQVSENVGKYSAQIALPSIMRKFQIGVASITLPTFGIEVYTNGDFQVDLGFPWNEDFSLSFSIEIQAGPFPVLGSAGFYFGKLSSATTNKVPTTTKGWFNPVIVFGFGAQIGLGKSVDAGILKAGFSLTVFGIIEGVIARWLPYGAITPAGDKSELQDGYYFSLTGTMGVQGRLYGSIDFAIISAELNIAISIYVRITFASYEPIPITARASVDVTLTVKINLGLFKISIHLGFHATVEATFVLDNPMKGPAPWAIDGAPRAMATFGRPSAPARLTARGLRKLAPRHGRNRFAVSAAVGAFNPNWNNLQQGTVLQLNGWVVPVLTVAGDAASTPDQQKICYVVNFFLQSEKPIQGSDSGTLRAEVAPSAAHVVARRDVAHFALARSRRLLAANAGPNKFEDLAVRVLQWVIAAGQNSPLTPDAVNALVISDDSLTDALSYLSGATTPTPIPNDAIEAFLKLQTAFLFSLKEDATADGDDAPVVFFPAAPGITLNVPAFAGSQEYSYSFGGYNSSSAGYLAALNDYFNQLKIQVQAEQKKQSLRAAGLTADTGPSIATYIFGDYFAMIGRLMFQAMRDGLRNYKLVIADYAGKTVQQLVDDINTKGQLSGDEQFTVGELFVANQTHALNPASTPAMTIAEMNWPLAGNNSFADVASQAIFSGGFDGKALALMNADNTTIIAPGTALVVGLNAYTTQTGDSLTAIALALKLADAPALLATLPGILSDPKFLATPSILQVPQFQRTIVKGDTLQTVAAQYGIDLDALAGANGGSQDLFDSSSDPNLNVPHLSQYEVGALIDEMKRTLALQHLSAMVSRYYLHGLRLPTNYGNEKLTPNADGLFVQKGGQYPADLGLYALTGQAFPLPTNIPDPSKQKPEDPKFSFTLNRGSESWLSLGTTGSASVTYTLTAQHDNSDYLRYQGVKKVALVVGGYLNTASSNVRPLDVAATKAARYPLSSEIPWQPAVAIVLPNQKVTPSTPRPSLWTLPTQLINVPNGTSVHPTLKPVLARTDEAKGTTVDADVNNYGFGTLITFTVKKIPSTGSSGVAQRTYEIIGAPESEITLLERLLNQLKDDASSFDQVGLFYHPSTTGSQAKGWQSDDAASSLMGITQTNLSTETRPPTGGFRAAALAGPNGFANLIGTPNEFLRLLWEASITRQGGFYLSYTTGIGGDLKGLPDHAFNERGEAELAAFALFTRGAGDPGQALANYMNVAVTNEPLDLSHAALVATVVPQSFTGRTFTAADTLTSYADSYYSRPSTLAQQNALVVFNATNAQGANLRVTVAGGVYEVPPPSGAPTRDNPGGDLSLIAQHFNTSVAEIKQVNAAGNNLPDQLNPYTAIILPQITVDAKGNSFDSLSKYYRAPIAEIAAANSETAGLFPTVPLNVTAGPLNLTPIVNQGVSGMTLQRTAPVVPAQPDDTWGTAFLQQNFSLLGYRVAGNPQNPYFDQSNWGLPSGPINPNPTDDGDKIQAPQAATGPVTWDFSFAVPYSSLFAKGQPGASPYGGVGSILQFEVAWLDIFGNRILSDFDNPNPGAGATLNKPPQITGYTDRLHGIGQWPAVAHAYQVKKDPSTGPNLTIQLEFDASAYADAAAAASGSGEAAETGKQKLQQAIAVYQSIVQQLNDPTGVTAVLTTTITPAASWTLPAKGTPDQPSLTEWAAAILAYLQALLAAPKSNPPIQRTLTFRVPLDVSQINTDEIFKLSATLTISRKPSLVAGELSAASGVAKAATQIAPLTGPLSSDSQDPQPQRNLSQFAIDFNAAFPTGTSYRIATGADRTVFTGNGKSPLWVVQLGGKGQPISYTIKDAGDPTVFAPRPISNVLQSKATTPIIQYQTGAPLSLTGPSQNRSFSSIDLDNWMRITLAAIDELLTPKYVAPAEILRKQIKTVTPPPSGWANALQAVLDAKKALADKLRAAMIPVYDKESASDQQLSDIREAFYQRMLGTMGQFYSVQAGVQFEADVQAAIRPQPSAKYVPRIFGDIEQASKSNTSLSSPKLDLKFTAGVQPAKAPSPYLSSLVSATATDAKKVTLDLTYNGQFIEHQIGTLDGIENYQASSWLSFVDISSAQGSADAPLQAELGQFDVPLVLREFPDTPALVNQDAVTNLVSPCYQPLSPSGQLIPRVRLLSGATDCPKPGTYNPLATATRWNYAFQYSMQVHYQQDEIHGEISFNLGSLPNLRRELGPQRDLFDNLAQFNQVFPQVDADLNTFLMPIDVGEKDPTKLQNAQYALQSAATMIQWIADSAGTLAGERRKLSEFAAGGVPPVTFTISEDGVEKENPDHQKVIALQVTVALDNVPPRVGIPLIQIDGYTCERASSNDPKTGIFFYRSQNGNNEYLLASDARNIPGRTFILPDLDILERQNAQTEIYLSRNADIVPGKTIAPPFVYKTNHVSFESPLHPTLVEEDPINLATIYSDAASGNPTPVQRTLACQLALFYEALFANAGTDDVTLQLGLYYEYAISADIQKIRLPVYLMPPMRIAIRPGGTGTALQDVIATQVKGWDTWFKTHTPRTDAGNLLFDLTVMSDLTERPMPILKMTGLYVPVADLA